jgi:hypothetical protein
MPRFSDNDFNLIEENAKVTFKAGYNETSFWLTLNDALINVEFWWDGNTLVATAYDDSDVDCANPSTVADWNACDFVD